MKKNMNFVVPCGYVGYSNWSKKVYKAGALINPFTVELVDIKTRVLNDTDRKNSVFETRERAVNTLEYRVTYHPKQENITEFRLFSEEILKTWLKENVDYERAHCLSTVNPYKVHVPGSKEMRAAEIRRGIEVLISEKLKKHMEKEMSKKITEAFPFLDINFNITNVEVSYPDPDWE